MSNKIKSMVERLTGAKIIKTFSGGSVAGTYAVQQTDGKIFVVKAANSDGINNGRRKLVREARQNNYLVKKYPDVYSGLLPKVLHIWEDKNFSAIKYEYIEDGKTFAECIKTGQWDDESQAHQLENLLILVHELYNLDRKKLKNNFFIVKNLSRGEFRIDYTKRKNSRIDTLLNSQTTVINGRKYQSAKELIGSIKRDEKLVRQLHCTYLSDCVHGDLNLKNVFLTSDNNIKLLDLRGSRQAWDIYYDLGKMLFTLGFDPICDFFYKPSIYNNGSISFAYTKGSEEIHHRWQRAAVQIEDILANSDAFKNFRESTPIWRKKVRLIFSIHFLADSACRLVAGSKTNQPLSSYVLGTYYLNKIMTPEGEHADAQEFYSQEQLI